MRAILGIEVDGESFGAEDMVNDSESAYVRLMQDKKSE